MRALLRCCRRRYPPPFLKTARAFCAKISSLPSALLCLCGRSQGDGCFCGEQKKRECLLKIQADSGVGVAEIADRDVLADVQVEVAATSRQHESAGDGGRPDDFVLDQPLAVFQHGISVVTVSGEWVLGIGTEQHGVGAMAADKPQLA